jgi:cell division transport system permease protein
MFRYKTDIPFARDDAHRFLPWTIAAMMAIAALLISLGLSLADALADQQRDVAGTIQIQIAGERPASQTETDGVVALLRRSAGVSDIVVLEKEAIAELLIPWLGDKKTAEDVPLPVLIEAKTAEGTEIDALRTSLAQQFPRARLVTPQRWVLQLAEVLALTQGTLLVLAFALMSAMVSLAVLIARVSLKLHFKTVNILHMFGATDDYILRQFQWQGGWLIGRGALIGSVVAGFLLLLLQTITRRMDSPVVPQVDFTAAHAVLLLLLPIFVALVAVVATRFSVQAMLQRMH